MSDIDRYLEPLSTLQIDAQNMCVVAFSYIEFHIQLEIKNIIDI